MWTGVVVRTPARRRLEAGAPAIDRVGRPDVGLRSDPGHPGIRSPAAVRHVIEAAVRGVRDDGTTARVEGGLVAHLCERGEKGDRIDFTFDGELLQQSDGARLRGAFEISGGTGRFAGIHGSGSMHGHLTCLESVLRRERAQSCADLGRCTDAVLFRSDRSDAAPGEVTGGLQGHYATRAV